MPAAGGEGTIIRPLLQHRKPATQYQSSFHFWVRNSTIYSYSLGRWLDSTKHFGGEGRVQEYLVEKHGGFVVCEGLYFHFYTKILVNHEKIIMV